MSQERLSMRKLQEVLRLKGESGLSHRAIARSCGISPATVSEYVQRASAAGLSWPLPADLTEDQLWFRLFPPTEPTQGRSIPLPDWAQLHTDLRRKGVTLRLLWVEYREAHPDGYGYTQFCEHYRQWAGHLQPTMRLSHVAGERLFVDYAGQTVPLVSPDTGEVQAAQIFVAVLGASSYTYVEAHLHQDLPSWIGAHVRALEFLGGVPEMFVPDNLKAGVKSPCRYEPDLNRTYHELAMHYGVGVLPTRPYKPRDKAKVETGVQIVQRWIVAALRHRKFFSLAELKERVDKLFALPNSKLARPKRTTPTR